MDMAEICTELRNMADGICAKMQRQSKQYEAAIKSLTEDRDALATRLECARSELAAVKDKYMAAISEYVELANRGIIRDSIIRDLFKRLRSGQVMQSHVTETERGPE